MPILKHRLELEDTTGKLCVKSCYDFTNDLSDDSYYLSMIPNRLKSSVDS